MTTYKLSNIARRSVSPVGKKKYRILYIENQSLIDPCIWSIPEFYICSHLDVNLGVDAIIKHEDSDIDSYQNLIRYHAPIINIVTNMHEEHQITKKYVNTYDYVIDKNRLGGIFYMNHKQQKSKQLLYIIDNDQEYSNAILKFLYKTKIGFDTIHTDMLKDFSIDNLKEILSEYKFVLNNTKEINLFIAYLCGSFPITFNYDLAEKNSYIKLINERSFADNLESEYNTKDAANALNTLYNYNTFKEQIVSLVEDLYTRPFIL